MKRNKYICDCEVIHEERVDEVRKKIPESGELLKLSNFFKILGDNTRTCIMVALEKQELCVCDLGALLGMSKSAISHQLKILKEADLVDSRREGKIIFYFLKDYHVKDIVAEGLEHIRE